MTRRTIWLPEGQTDVEPFQAIACMTHTRMVPCVTCDAADQSLDVIWSQRPSDIQHVRNEEAWRRVR